MRTSSARGFTIVELVVVMAVLALLLFVAVPSFAGFLRNQQIRVAGDAILNGLQVARVEAMRRNVSVQVAVNVPATGWTVSESASGALIQSRTHEEGSPNAIVATTPGGATTITFTPLGGVTSNADGSFPVNQFDVNFNNPGGLACQTPINPAGPRCVRILVSGGGSTRMCDPAVSAIPPNPRACP
jgi:type IV fimbrial biogenesis protein FimT